MRKILAVISLFVICGLLTAGLWPFNLFARNNAAWLKDENGLHFGEHGTIYSAGPFEFTRSEDDSLCSLELWLQPAVASSKESVTILDFYTPNNPLQFRLKQDGDALLLKRDYRDTHNHLRTNRVDIAHAFRQDEPSLFSITSRLDGTAVYRNGGLLKVFPRFALSCRDFSGQLVIGGSPVVYNTWQGKVLSLAIYTQELTPEQVSRHYAMWVQKVAPKEFKNDRAVALYSFAERSGSVVHNATGSQPELYIPRIFAIPHKRMLARPWEEFSPDLGYATDILINVAGFVPFGFFFCACLAWNRLWPRAGRFTILFGAFISVTIEILQGFIPARMSGTTDIITNTLGTALGVILWKWRPVQLLADRLRKPVQLVVAERCNSTLVK